MFAQALGYPITVSWSKSHIRMMCFAVHERQHERQDLNFGLEAFEKVGWELDVISSPTEHERRENPSLYRLKGDPAGHAHPAQPWLANHPFGKAPYDSPQSRCPGRS